MATTLLDDADNIFALAKGFSMGVLIPMGEGFLTLLEESCALGDIRVKHSKFAFEMFDKQESMMDCRLFNTFRIA